MLKLLPFMGHAAAIVTLVSLASISIWASGHIATDRVPMQWGLDGEPTWFAGKQIGLWLPVVISAFALSTQLYVARRAASSMVPSSYTILIVMCLVLLAVYVWHLRKVIAWSQMQG